MKAFLPFPLFPEENKRKEKEKKTSLENILFNIKRCKRSRQACDEFLKERMGVGKAEIERRRKKVLLFFFFYLPPVVINSFKFSLYF